VSAFGCRQGLAQKKLPRLPAPETTADVGRGIAATVKLKGGIMSRRKKLTEAELQARLELLKKVYRVMHPEINSLRLDGGGYPASTLHLEDPDDCPRKLLLLRQKGSRADTDQPFGELNLCLAWVED
jgi:hypothetical protein